MARLIVVSNRVANPNDRSARAGGLAVAMREALDHCGGMWFGWSGEIKETVSPTPHVVQSGDVTFVTVDLKPEDYQSYYIDYANSTLWPLFHFRVGLIDYSRQAFEGYLKVNAQLAATLAPMIQPGDVIWVHDYHLIPFGDELRKLGIKNRIGFFLHTPFPPRQLLETLPRHTTLLHSLAAYDLVGFQTDESLRAFQDSIVDLARGRLVADGEFVLGERRSRAATFPIGIDTERFARLARRTAQSRDSTRLEESLTGRALIIGVDRLDYSKGLPQRFQAIDTLLTEHPEHRNQFSYLQITPHSRADVAQYRALAGELEAKVGAVNGKFAQYDWTPVRYVNQAFSRLVLAGFYRLARIGLVTPLRDGMNLVAKEFVAAQDPRDPGVLILSRFAGAAQELKAAIQVNPYDADDIASAIHRSLAMGLDERQMRWTHMMEAIEQNTVT
ncbi:MAG TPA: trehalose-6-phosphate synthase, partial [Stellaceae bacterium]|nr:trehalose-6-phosphate synthase [Stellaceae bacterium]